MNALVARVTGQLQENTQDAWEVDGPFLDQALEQLRKGLMDRLREQGITGPEADANWLRAKKDIVRTFRTFAGDKTEEYGKRLGIWRRPDPNRASYSWMAKE